MSSARNVPLTAPAQENLQHEESQCRICLQNGGNDLIAPCLCKGTTKWVHRKCLDQWRANGQGRRTFTHCPNCQFAYLMQLVRAPTEHEQHLRERRRKLLRHAVGTFVLGALLIQLLLILVAIVIRALDPEEGLVDMMPFFQPKLPDERGFWMAFRYHKSTYYFASVIFCLAVTGLSVLVFTLIRCCVIPRARPAPTCCDMCCWDPCPYNRGYGGPYVYVHGDTRCCVDCCNACCPDSRSSNCMPSSGGGGSSSGNSNNNAAAAIALVLIIILALIGIFFLMAALVTWIQKVWARYMALKELQELTGEYIVQDLAELEKTIGKVDVEQGTAVPGTGDDEVPSAPPLWVPMMPQEVQSNLSRDLQAVYGYQS